MVAKSGNSLQKYMENSRITVLSYDSLYGIILKLEYTGDNCPYEIVDENQKTPMQFMLVKLAIISDRYKRTLGKMVVEQKLVSKSAMKEDEFMQEIQTQFKLVGKTIQLYEPICPAVIHWHVQDIHIPKTFFRKNIFSTQFDVIDTIMKNQSYKTDTLVNTVMKWIIQYSDLKLGVIAMELMNDYDTLHSQFGDVPDSTSILYINYAIYELIRLGSVGYVHGDAHARNLLINTNSHYFTKDETYKGRAMLIDFGRTYKIDYPMKMQCEEVLNGNIDKLNNQLLQTILMPQNPVFFSDYWKSYVDLIDNDLLKALIISRNRMILANVQNPDYVKNTNTFIKKYNSTIHRRLRSWKDMLRMKAPRLLSTDYTRKIRQHPRITTYHSNPLFGVAKTKRESKSKSKKSHSQVHNQSAVSQNIQTPHLTTPVQPAIPPSEISPSRKSVSPSKTKKKLPFPKFG